MKVLNVLQRDVVGVSGVDKEGFFFADDEVHVDGSALAGGRQLQDAGGEGFIEGVQGGWGGRWGSTPSSTCGAAGTAGGGGER